MYCGFVFTGNPDVIPFARQSGLGTFGDGFKPRACFRLCGLPSDCERDWRFGHSGSLCLDQTPAFCDPLACTPKTFLNISSTSYRPISLRS